MLLATAFHLAPAAAVGRSGAWFRRPVIRLRLAAVSGTVLIALGPTTRCITVAQHGALSPGGDRAPRPGG